MNFTTEHIDAVLSAWFEGDLPDAERRKADAHLRECLRCASLVRDIEALRREASRLPEMTPSRDLWDGIAARIEAPVIELKPRQAPMPARRTWQMAAAAVVLMAVSSGITYLVTGQRGIGSDLPLAVTSDSIVFPGPATPNVVTPRPRPSSGSTVLVSGDPSAPEIMYDQEITRLRLVLDQRRGDLDSATVATVEKSLKAIDRAIIDARTALSGDAASPFLTDQLNKALERKLGVLRRVALLPVGGFVTTSSVYQTIVRAGTLLLCLAATLPAQSQRNREKEKEREARERVIEQRVERITRNIEKTVEQTVEASVNGAMRSVEAALANVDRHYQGYNSRQGSNSRSSSQERIDTTFAFRKDGVLELTTFGGDIVVTGWNRQEARIRGMTERGTRWRVSSARITIESEGYRGRSSDSQYEITVPLGVRVVLRSMNGSLAVRGVNGAVDLHTNNGDVEVVDAVGRVEMVTLSGDAKGTRIRGTVDATSLNGTVALTDVQGASIAAESTSGDVQLVNVVSPDVEASTVSGEVDFSGPLDPKGRYSFASHSGTVALTIPANTSARFSIETFNGDIDSDFPFTLQPNRERRNGQRLEFNVGAGEARVTAESFSGGVTIRRSTPRR